MKKIKLLITLGLYLIAGCFVFATLAQAATPSTNKKNVWTDRQTFKGDVDMWQDFEFKTDATITGSPTWTGSPKWTPVTLSFVAGVGYTVTGPTTGKIFLVPTSSTDEGSLISSTGVTVLIQPPSADNLGWEPTIINTSGTSPMVLFISGQGDTATAIKTIGTSGTTYITTYDAEGDSVTLGYYEVDGTGVSVFIKSDIVDGS